MNLRIEEEGKGSSKIGIKGPNTTRSDKTNESLWHTLDDYEKMVQKLEADVRQHIRVEQQLKLHIDNIQERAEEDGKFIEKLNKEKDRHQRERKRMDEMLTIREKEITKLEKELKDTADKLQNVEQKHRQALKELSDAKSALVQLQNFHSSERKPYSMSSSSKNEIRNFSRSNERKSQKDQKRNFKP